MPRLVTAAILVGVACGAYAQIALGQTPDGQPSFEVATVKPVPPPAAIKGSGDRVMMRMGSRGGPGSNDPGRYTCNNCNLQMLMVQAYGVESYQLTIPSSMENERFDVSAKVPEGATKDQFNLMLQNLLAERFKLKIHRETKEGQVYELTVNKGGVKMKESAPPEPVKEASSDAPPGAPPFPALNGGKLTLDKDGFPVMPKGIAGGGGPMTIRMPGKARMTFEQESMEDFVKVLARQLAKPVTDLTGLKAKYDFTMTWDGANLGGGLFGPGGRGQVTFSLSQAGPGGPPPGGDRPGADRAGSAASDGATPLSAGSDSEGVPTLFGALQSQLGLKLEAKKGQMELIVVDHVEKVPTEN
jgi:uncharacterized protein (TIGR03435 family)